MDWPQQGLQAPRRVGHPHGPKAHEGTIVTDRPDELWTDITTTVTTEEGQVCVFVAVDPAIASASASTPLGRANVLRSWSHSAKACGNNSAAASAGSPPGWAFAVTTVVPTLATISSKN